eukprot:PhM_4_TR629/c1_g1_i1/m.30090
MNEFNRNFELANQQLPPQQIQTQRRAHPPDARLYNDNNHHNNNNSNNINNNNMYKRNPLTLFFVDPAVEGRYFTFLYCDRGFLGGKLLFGFTLWVFGAQFISIDDIDSNIIGRIARFTSYVILGSWVTIVPLIRHFLSPVLFTSNIERMFLASVFVVGFSSIISGHSRNTAAGIALTNVTAFVQGIMVALLSQARFLPLTLVYFAVTLLSSIHHYLVFDQPPIAIMWYAVYVFCPLLHYFLELQVRTSFTEIDRAEQQLYNLDVRIRAMHRIVVSYLPRTASKDFLNISTASIGCSSFSSVQQHKLYKNTVLVVTDIVGFTAWSTRNPASVVVDVLARCFRALDEVAAAYSVEKITTVGDSYVGAIFPWLREEVDGEDVELVEHTALRCVRAIRFAVLAASLPSRIIVKEKLMNRVGVHMGDVVGGFVGISPPRFDLFGFTTDLTKHMESTSCPGKVHVSNDAMEMAMKIGMPIDASDTDEGGVILSGWVDRTNEHGRAMNSPGTRHFLHLHTSIGAGTPITSPASTTTTSATLMSENNFYPGVVSSSSSIFRSGIDENGGHDSDDEERENEDENNASSVRAICERFLALHATCADDNNNNNNN